MITAVTASPEDVLAALSTFGAFLAAGSGWLAARSAQKAEARSKQLLLQDQPIDTRDPIAVRDFLYDKAGPLTLAQYRRDPEIRRVVDLAIANAEQLTSRSASGTASVDAETGALDLLAQQRYPEAFVRIRLEIELQLHRIAALHGISVDRMGPRRALSAVASTDERVAQLAPELADIIGLANAAIHGAPIDRGAAEWAGRSFESVLRTLRQVNEP